MKFLFERITNSSNSKYLQMSERAIHITAVLMMIGFAIFGLIDASNWITFIGDSLWDAEFFTFVIWSLLGILFAASYLISSKTKLITHVNIENTKIEIVKISNFTRYINDKIN